MNDICPKISTNNRVTRLRVYYHWTVLMAVRASGPDEALLVGERDGGPGTTGEFLQAKGAQSLKGGGGENI